jgi:hypothetical protein
MLAPLIGFDEATQQKSPEISLRASGFRTLVPCYAREHPRALVGYQGKKKKGLELTARRVTGNSIKSRL